MQIFLLVLSVVASNAIGTEAYMVFQGSKGDNRSDPVIHKVAPNKFKAISDSRRKLSGSKRYEIRSRPAANEDSLESVVLAINTGATSNKLEKGRSNFMQKLQELLEDFLKDDRVESFFRSKTDTYNVKPEIVHFRSGKPSLMVEVNFESIMRALRDALRSRKVKQYVDKWAQKAAMVYRAIQDETKSGSRAKENL